MPLGPLNRVTWTFLKIDMQHQQGLGTCDMRAKSDMGHTILFNLTCDVGGNKRQRHATLSIIKIDMRHWGPQSRAPSNSPPPAVTFHLHGSILDRTISHDISKIENNTQSPYSFSVGTRNYSCASRPLYVHIISQVAKNVVASKNRLRPPTKNQSQEKKNIYSL